MKRINNTTKEIIKDFVSEIGEDIKECKTPQGRTLNNLMIANPIDFRYFLLDVLEEYGKEGKYRIFSKKENMYFGAKELEQYLFGDVQVNELYNFN